jgi:hypothetical protein|tara:strand:- start:487 stop:1083 length:597 start_codon:yes stop_codon:yes gene_type:complete
MSWEDVLKKFGEKQTPRKPYESKEEYLKRLGNQQEESDEFEEVKEILQKPEEQEGPAEKFKLRITGQGRYNSLHGKWAEIAGYPEGHSFNSRREAYDALKREAAIGNPRPWTVEGNLYAGQMNVYDGVFQMINAPSYYYIIIEENEKLPDAASFHARTDWTSREAVLDRMRGYEADPEEQTFGDRNYLGEKGHEDLVE